MPPLFAIISFLGYRWFRDFVYFKIVRDTYEAFTIAAFFALMLALLDSSPIEQGKLIARKEKRKLPLPLCCFRYRPSKPYFIFTVKWSVLQFVIVKPLLSIASIVTEALNVFCSTSQSFKFAHVYIEIVDFLCVSIALYGLIVLNTLVHDELQGHRILAKFTTIKIVVALVFYQGFVFIILEHYDLIKATPYWTSTNVSDGLNALVTTIEMIFIALFQLYAFPHTEYKLLLADDREDVQHTSFWNSFAHSQNYSDFATDIWASWKFFIDRLCGKSYTKASQNYAASIRKSRNRFDLQTAIGGESLLGQNSTSIALETRTRPDGDFPKTFHDFAPSYPPHPAPVLPYRSPSSTFPTASLVPPSAGKGLSHLEEDVPADEYKKLEEDEKSFQSERMEVIDEEDDNQTGLAAVHNGASFR